MPKISGYVKTFKDKNRDKDKSKKVISFRVDDDKPLIEYKTIWTKIKDLKNIELNSLPVYDAKLIKYKIRTCGDKFYTNFCSLNVPEDGSKGQSFTILSIDT